MKKRRLLLLGGALMAALGAIPVVVLSIPQQEASAVSDPRQDPPIVRLTTGIRVTGAERSFTGVIGARVQSGLGFRVSGKIMERFVDAGQGVEAGQLLMRLDETDLQLALTAKRNAVAVARAALVPARADEKRYAALLKNGLAASQQRYEQAKAALDIAQAQVAAAEAEARVAENQATYSLLLADMDGTVIETLAEPGQVVAAGQTVIRLAQAGPREAVVALPETIRPTIGSGAEASLYGSDQHRYKAHLRQLSDSADPQTRTYEARYVLDGEAAEAPLGATVTIHLESRDDASEYQVPLGALLDDGEKTGVWVFDDTTSTVSFRPVGLVRITDETAVVTGLVPSDTIVALGAHLLQDGAQVRAESESGGAK
ncbi:efflux RND transporter periplasmic adaptor subunit [Rhodospirillaceae bacterium KN72]|uniref:Efflux RND transporter periplasmic adaptor subunit n=2 Tax=Pacificispira spongiicola TaxID=2729598 RepID=A0A7Y0HG26_9PROT|nr:efflux RND transporter periplasmic adaptor subunit [Pacificispira spongiicola]